MNLSHKFKSGDRQVAVSNEYLDFQDVPEFAEQCEALHCYVEASMCVKN